MKKQKKREVYDPLGRDSSDTPAIIAEESYYLDYDKDMETQWSRPVPRAVIEKMRRSFAKTRQQNTD